MKTILLTIFLSTLMLGRQVEASCFVDNMRASRGGQKITGHPDDLYVIDMKHSLYRGEDRRGVIYLNEQERKGYQVIFKDDDQGATRLFHTPEARERLYLEKVGDFIEEGKISLDSADFKRTFSELDDLEEEVRKKVAKEFDKKMEDMRLRVEYDPQDYEAMAFLDDSSHLKQYVEEAVEIKYARAARNDIKDRLAKIVESDPEGRRKFGIQLEEIREQLKRPVEAKKGSIYVMDSEGNIYINERPAVDLFHHSSFVAGEPVAGAGEMTIVQGIPRYIDNESGHYLPPPPFVEQVVLRMRRGGLDLNGTQLGQRTTRRVFRTLDESDGAPIIDPPPQQLVNPEQLALFP